MTRQQALQRVATSASSFLNWVRRVPVQARLQVKDWHEAQDEKKGEPMLLVHQRRQDDLLSFNEHFERLIEIICDACQYGGGNKLGTAYEAERKWMQTHYFLVRPYVTAYLALDSEDAEQSIVFQGFASDAFQTLFAATDIEALLKSDDGNMISRIIRSRQALALYAEHLRQLIAREKECS